MSVSILQLHGQDLPSLGVLPALTPVFKSNESADPGNYRGIAVGTLFAKLYAFIMSSRFGDRAEVTGLQALCRFQGKSPLQ